MNKYVQDIIQYIWIPFMLGFVLYIFQSQHDLALAIVVLLAFSAVYTLVRVYFASRKWYFLAAASLVIIGALGFYMFRPHGMTLSVNGQHVTGSSVSFTEGKVIVNPSPGADGKYAKGTVVSLTASPDAGFDLGSWTGTSNDITGTTTVTMGRSLDVTITFKPRSTLIINNQTVIGATVSFTEGGSISVNPAPEEDGKYTKDTIVTIKAIPSSGHDWSEWSGTDTNTANPTTVTMSGNKQITVIFQPRSFLYINNQVVSDVILGFPEGSVSITPAPGNDDKYARGTVVSLTANPDAAYGLKNWSGTSNIASNPTTVNITSDKHVTVTFELRYALMFNGQQVAAPGTSLIGGTISFSPAPLADGRYAKDMLVNMTATPEAGYRFDRWSGDASGSTAAATISMSSGKSVTAGFIRTYSLAASVSPALSGNVSVSPPAGPYDTGSTVTLTASPRQGFRFDHWAGDVSGNGTTMNVTMDSDKSISAVFKKVFELTTSVTPAGSGTITPSGGSFDEGVVITLSASPAAGFTFSRWEGDASGNATATANMTAGRNIIGVFSKLTP
jgi:hypothetical protein